MESLEKEEMGMCPKNNLVATFPAFFCGEETQWFIENRKPMGI